jgi:dihydrofolate reductase
MVGDMDEAAMADGAALLGSIDTILLGRVSYDGFSQYWPPATGEWADLMNRPPKVVFSRSGEAGPLPWGEFGNARLVAGPLAAEAVKELKAGEGGDMVLLASAGLTQSFSDLGLIDEYQIHVLPVLLGAGKLLFAGGHRRQLGFVSAKSYPKGWVRLTYRRVD